LERVDFVRAFPGVVQNHGVFRIINTYQDLRVAFGRNTQWAMMLQQEQEFRIRGFVHFTNFGRVPDGSLIDKIGMVFDPTAFEGKSGIFIDASVWHEPPSQQDHHGRRVGAKIDVILIDVWDA
jgi:hypothetical protein